MGLSIKTLRRTEWIKLLIMFSAYELHSTRMVALINEEIFGILKVVTHTIVIAFRDRKMVLELYLLILAILHAASQV